MYYVYLLKCADGNHYIGYTQDIDNRFNMHNNGRVKSTKGRRPLSLVGYEEYNTMSEARWREHTLKKSAHTRKKFIEKLERKCLLS